MVKIQKYSFRCNRLSLPDTKNPAGKSLVQYTFEDKCAEKETDRLLLAILFSTLFAVRS